MTKLLPFQNEGVLGIYHFAGRALLADEQGLGKTIQALDWIRRLPKLRPAIIVCPSSVKYSWQSEASNHFGLRTEVIEGRAKKKSRLPGNISIINYDILASWVKVIRRARPQVLVLDECFPPKVKVTTEEGEIEIGELVRRKIPTRVLSVTETGEHQWRNITRHIQLARRRPFVNIVHEKGKIKCTDNHPIWTFNRGYIQAKDLQPSDTLRVVRTTHGLQEKQVLLRDMRRTVEGKAQQGMEGENGEGVAEDSGASHLEQKRETQSRSLQVVEGKQPHEKQRLQTKGARHTGAERDASQVDGEERRKRTTNGGPAVTPQATRGGLGNGESDPHNHSQKMGNGVSELLQSGPGEHSLESGSGGGREIPLLGSRTAEGWEENETARVLRVEGFPADQSGGDGEPATGGEEIDFVYCLEVEGNHNFFADGVLVSNCHYITNPTAKRTKACLAISRRVRSVVGTSGTPMTNKPIELWSVLQAINPDIFPSRPDYAWRYCKPRWVFGEWKYDGSTNTKELHSILMERCMIRRLKKDVYKELPPVAHRAVPFKLSSYEEYNAAQRDFISWLKKKNPSKAKRAARNAALTKVGYMLRLVAQLKIEWTARWIADFLENNPNEKLVGLTMHRFVIDYLIERFRGQVLFVDGRIRGKKRHDTVRAFQTNRKYRLLVGNWKAAGVGITLTAASNIAALDLPWTPGDLAQGRDRIHRIGQKKNCFLHYLMAMGTLEEKQVKLLRKKSKVMEAILDGRDVEEDLNFFDELLEELKQVKV